MPNPVKLHVIEPNGPDKYHIREEIDEQVRDTPVTEHGVGHRNADESSEEPENSAIKVPCHSSLTSPALQISQDVTM